MRPTSMPVGRVARSVISPIGSGSAATCSTPCGHLLDARWRQRQAVDERAVAACRSSPLRRRGGWLRSARRRLRAQSRGHRAQRAVLRRGVGARQRRAPPRARSGRARACRRRTRRFDVDLSVHGSILDPSFRNSSHALALRDALDDAVDQRRVRERARPPLRGGTRRKRAACIGALPCSRQTRFSRNSCSGGRPAARPPWMRDSARRSSRDRPQHEGRRSPSPRRPSSTRA